MVSLAAHSHLCTKGQRNNEDDAGNCQITLLTNKYCSHFSYMNPYTCFTFNSIPVPMKSMLQGLWSSELTLSTASRVKLIPLVSSRGRASARSSISGCFLAKFSVASGSCRELLQPFSLSKFVMHCGKNKKGWSFNLIREFYLTLFSMFFFFLQFFSYNLKYTPLELE